MKNTLIAIILSLATLPIMAQHTGRHHGEGNRFTPEEFRNRMEHFVTQKADLTSDEAKAFMHIYCEFKDKQREIQRKTMKLKQLPEGSTPSEYEKNIMEIAAMDNAAAALETKYYKRLCKEVPAYKVYRAIIAIDDFHRRMLQNFNSKGHHRAGRGQGN